MEVKDSPTSSYFVDVECVSPEPRTLETIDSAFIECESSYKINLEKSDVLTEQLLRNKSSRIIMGQCKKTYWEVIEKHYALRGISFGVNPNGKFLRPDYLQEALNKATKECYDMLNHLLSITCIQSEEDRVRTELQDFLKCTCIRIADDNEQLRVEFVNQSKICLWDQMIHTLQVRYHLLFQNYSELSNKPFYRHDNMQQFVAELIKKSDRDISEYLQILVENASLKREPDNDNVDKVSFDTLRESIKKATNELLDKNQEHQTFSNEHIAKIIQVQFVEESKKWIEKAISNDPWSISREERIRAALGDTKRNCVLENVGKYVKSACLEVPASYENKWKEEIDSKLEEVIKHGMAFQMERQRCWDKMFGELEREIPETVKRIWKGNLFPKTSLKDLLNSLMTRVKETKDRKICDSHVPLVSTKPRDAQTSGDLKRTSSSDCGSSSKRKSKESRNHNGPTEESHSSRKRSKGTSSSTSSSSVSPPPARNPSPRESCSRKRII